MENLEAMQAAHNYNAHIAGLVCDAVASAPARDLAIDFGAGIGTFTGILAERFANVIAIEIEEPSITALRAEGYDVRRELAEVADASADCIVSISVLEHLDDDGAALREIRRVLKPAGVLFLYLPAFESCWSRMDERVGHRRRYTRESLATRLRAADLEPISGRYVDSIGAVASMAMRVAGHAGVLTNSSVGAYDRWVFPLSRALDRLAGRSFGKNVVMRAVRAA